MLDFAKEAAARFAARHGKRPNVTFYDNNDELAETPDVEPSASWNTVEDIERKVGRKFGSAERKYAEARIKGYQPQKGEAAQFEQIERVFDPEFESQMLSTGEEMKAAAYPAYDIAERFVKNVAGIPGKALKEFSDSYVTPANEQFTQPGLAALDKGMRGKFGEMGDAANRARVVAQTTGRNEGTGKVLTGLFGPGNSSPLGPEFRAIVGEILNSLDPVTVASMGASAIPSIQAQLVKGGATREVAEAMATRIVQAAKKPLVSGEAGSIGPRGGTPFGRTPAEIAALRAEREVALLPKSGPKQMTMESAGTAKQPKPWAGPLDLDPVTVSKSPALMAEAEADLAGTLTEEGAVGKPG